MRDVVVAVNRTTLDQSTVIFSGTIYTDVIWDLMAFVSGQTEGNLTMYVIFHIILHMPKLRFWAEVDVFIY